MYVDIYISAIDSYARVRGQFYGLELKRLVILEIKKAPAHQRNKTMVKLDLEMVVNKGESCCRIEDGGKKTVYPHDVRN